MHFDRYRLCRKKCKSLEAFLKKTPDAKELLKPAQEREKGKERFVQLSLFSGRNLPDADLRCKSCDFTAKSPRGLKVHRSRTHKAYR